MTQSLNANKTNPQIYVSCLNAYNNGRIWGRWISTDQDAQQIYDDIQDMLAKSPALGICEEYAIHCSSGFGQVTLHEYESIEDVVTLSRLICEYGESLASHMWLHTCDAEEAERMLQENYIGGNTLAF
jgi:antirestriction protein